MTDVEAIKHLLAHYWHHLDDRREPEWVDLFDDGAVLQYEGMVARSRRELQAIAADLKNHAPGKHLSSNEVVEIDGDAATAQSDVVFLSPDGDGSVKIRFYGRCTDTLRRSGLQWRFTSRTITFQGGVHG
jgi:hypothetical protein